MSCNDHGLRNCPRFPLLPVPEAAKASLTPAGIHWVKAEWRILDQDGVYKRGSQRVQLFLYREGNLNNVKVDERPEFLSNVLNTSEVGVPTAIPLSKVRNCGSNNMRQQLTPYSVTWRRNSFQNMARSQYLPCESSAAARNFILTGKL